MVKNNSARVAIIALSDISKDPRVMRQIDALSLDYEITVIGFGDVPPARCSFIQIPHRRRGAMAKLRHFFSLMTKRHEAALQSSPHVLEVLPILKNVHFDLIIANDIETLPMVFADDRKIGLVFFDAHEYAEQEWGSWRWRYLYGSLRRYMCRKYIPKCCGMMTVCKGIADRFYVDLGILPTVITNAPLRSDLIPSPVLPDRIRLIHHGRAMPERQIEDMITAMRYLDERFTLDLMLIPGTPGYLEHLKRISFSISTVRFLEPVRMQDLPTATNGYDMGVYLLSPTSFNNHYALPNKFFEYIQARLGVAIGPSPEMARIVREFSLGVVATDFSPRAFAASLMSVNQQSLVNYKISSHRAAKVLNSDSNAKVIRRLVNAALKRNSGSLND